jgi:uncharacterized membrane protein
MPLPEGEGEILRKSTGNTVYKVLGLVQTTAPGHLLAHLETPIRNVFEDRTKQDSEMQLVLQPGYRLLTSLIAGYVMVRLTPWLPPGSRIVLGWNTGVTVLLGLIATMMWRSDPQQTLKRARKEETSNILILLVTILTAAGALVTITYGLPKAGSMSPILRVFDICEAAAGVFLAWLLIHVMYSLHYAKLYYGDPGDTRANLFTKGLTFPGNKDVVDYWDFVYYSFTIAMCFQTSDVTVTSPYMRRLTIFHAIVSYFFALAILGLLFDELLSNIT